MGERERERENALRGTEKKTDEDRAKAANTAVMDCFSSNAKKMAALMYCFQQ